MSYTISMKIFSQKLSLNTMYTIYNRLYDDCALLFGNGSTVFIDRTFYCITESNISSCACTRQRFDSQKKESKSLATLPKRRHFGVYKGKYFTNHANRQLYPYHRVHLPVRKIPWSIRDDQIHDPIIYHRKILGED
jgi:hypothetical protein